MRVISDTVREVKYQILLLINPDLINPDRLREPDLPPDLVQHLHNISAFDRLVLIIQAR
jgi:hypothetical protein